MSFTIDAYYDNPYKSYFVQCKKDNKYPFLVPMPQVPNMQMQGKMPPYMMPVPYMNYPFGMMPPSHPIMYMGNNIQKNYTSNSNNK
ncbi:MAG: hypothetical protein MJ252_19070 [archaeon]|nr:hypothetical protein [archaeon]